MTFDRLYRASLYATLFLAAFLLGIDSPDDSRTAMLYPVGVAAAAVLAYATIDRDQKRGLPRDVANYLGVLAMSFGLLEWYADPNMILMAIGHTLLLLQIVMFFLPKTVGDDWLLFLIGLVVAVIGVYTPSSDYVGAVLLLWALSSLWTFGLFFLRRESLRKVAADGVTIRPLADPANPYPGLLNLSFVLSVLGIAAVTLALGGGIFLLMPRWHARGVSRFGKTPSAKHLTGFSPEVQLGRMGEILENDSVVMSMEFTDREGQVVTPDPELRLRGVTLTRYSGGKWTRSERDYRRADRVFRNLSVSGKSLLRQRVKMEATDSDVLFAVRPVLRVSTGTRNEVLFNTYDGTIVRQDLREDLGESAAGRSNQFDYTVISETGAAAPQEGEVPPDQDRMTELMEVPPDLQEPLEEISERVVEELRPKARKSLEVKARALERYLRDGSFTYSLKMEVKDPTIDPVLDFLRNRKEGHCEYFASALTLLCRAQGIPARMVNGFKGGDWDELGRALHVREKHAHSWVEGLISEPGEPAVWVVLDPTPSRQRAAVVAQVGASSVRFRYLGDALRTLWVFYISGYDTDRQEKIAYGPLRELGAYAMRGFRIFGEVLRDARQWFYFESPGQFFSVRGFFVSVFAMLGLVAAFRVLSWLVGLAWRLVLPSSRGAAAEDPGLAFYYRLARALAAIDLTRAESETPREFARRAASALEARPATAPIADLPGGVVDLFYAKRFGLRDPSPEALSDLDRRLSELEAALGPESTGRSVAG